MTKDITGACAPLRHNNSFKKQYSAKDSYELF